MFIPTILEGRKFKYSLPIDPNDGDKATALRFFTFARPHMRAFWATNVGHRATIFMWFSAVPLYTDISDSLGLTKSQIWTSSMWAIAGALLSRFFMGFICERYGARIPLAALIIFASVATALQGVVQTAEQFYVARFFVGIGGGSVVASTFWLNCMFKKEIIAGLIGFSNGIGVAASTCSVFLGNFVMPALTSMTGSREIAWRSSFSVITFGALCVGLPLAYLTDDMPKGNYSKLKRKGELNPIPHWENICASAKHVSVWILCIQHACNFGIELVINEVMLRYVIEEFGVHLRLATFTAAIFPLASQINRSIGGRLSDKANKLKGMKGRLQCQLVFLLMSGIFFLIYSMITNLWLSVLVLGETSLFVFFSQASTFGIVPYINADSNGVVSGMVNASGTMGGILLGFVFRELPYRDAFYVTGILLILSSFLTLFLVIPGHGGFFSNGETIAKFSRSESSGETSVSSLRSSSGASSIEMYNENL